MTQSVNKNLAWLLLLALFVAPAGGGCARFRKRPVAAVAPQAGEAAITVAAEGNGARHTNGSGRVEVDAKQVMALQAQALDAQNAMDGAGIQRTNRVTRWLDRTHETWFRRMDNAVRRVDTMWLTDDIKPYDYKLSTFKFKLLTRVGGRSNDGDSEYKFRFRADFALPGLKRKLHLFLDNAPEDALPGTDPMEQEDDTRLGARALLKTLRDNRLDFGGGLRLHSARPILYASAGWEWKHDLQGGMLRLAPRGFWYDNEDGFGQTTSLAWTRQVGNQKYFQLRTAERTTEDTNGWEFEQTVRFAWLRSGKTRGWVAQASVFPHYKDSNWSWDDSMVNLSWRGALYRKWIYYTITPQVDFPKEDDYHVKASLRLGLEILMGGKISDLF